MSTWADVRVGDVVEGSNNSLWQVAAFDQTIGQVTLDKCDTGRIARSVVDPTRSVKIVQRALEQAEAAEALVQVRLGGQAVARQNEHGDWMTPPVFIHPGAMLGHLLIFHSVSLDAATTIGESSTQHHALHQRGIDAIVPHVHDPDWFKGRA